MGYRCFEVDVTDRVAHLRLSRPDELNSMVPEFWRELPEIVRSISDSGEARALVLSSTGKHFSAGMDLSVFAGGLGMSGDGEPARRSANLRSTVLRLQDTFTVFEKARMPVLVAVQGGCIGGAVDHHPHRPSPGAENGLPTARSRRVAGPGSPVCGARPSR